jgi:hypothetical protein
MIPSKSERGVRLRSIRLGELGGVIAAEGARPQWRRDKLGVSQLEAVRKANKEESQRIMAWLLAIVTTPGFKDND